MILHIHVGDREIVLADAFKEENVKRGTKGTTKGGQFVSKGEGGGGGGKQEVSVPHAAGSKPPVYHYTSPEGAKAIQAGGGKIRVSEGVIGYAAYLTENPQAEGTAKGGGARLDFKVSPNARIVELTGAGSAVDRWLRENGTPKQYEGYDIAGALEHAGIDAIRLTRPSGDVWWLLGEDQSKFQLV